MSRLNRSSLAQMIGSIGLACPLDRRVQLRPVILSATLDLGEGLDQVERLRLGKPGDRRALRYFQRARFLGPTLVINPIFSARSLMGAGDRVAALLN